MEDTMRKIGFALASLLLPVLMAGEAGWPGRDALAATGDTLIVTGDGVNVRYGPSTDAKVRMRVYHDQLVTELQREGDWVRAEIAGSDGASGWIHTSLLAVPSADQLARARERAMQPPRAGLPEVKPPAPPAAANPAPPAPASPATAPAPARPSTSGAATPEPSTATAPTAEPSNAAPSPSSAATFAPSPGESGTSAATAPEPAAVAPAAGPADAADAADLARFRDSVDYLNSRSTSVAGADLFDGVQAVGDGVVQVGATDAWSSIPPAGQQSYANTLLDRWAAARGYSGPVAVQIVDANGKVLLETKKP
jgi:Bacterial SH3 domain